MTRVTKLTLRVLGYIVDCEDIDVYGGRISQSLDVKTGSLYPLLNRLEKLNVLSAYWEDIDTTLQGRPRRKYYRIFDDAVKYSIIQLLELRGYYEAK